MKPGSWQRSGPKRRQEIVWPDDPRGRKQKTTSDVLAHPLGPLPWALTNGDWTLRKNKLSPESSATVFDGMSLVQKLKRNDKTFAELAETALSHVLHEGAKSY